MTSKRYKKLPENTFNLTPAEIEKLIPTIKKNCTSKFDESVDLSFQINNKQKKGEINIRTVVNLPGGTGKKLRLLLSAKIQKHQRQKMLELMSWVVMILSKK